MEEEEWLETVACVDCGEPVCPGADRAFAVSGELFLCFGCAERRGGVFDEDEDRWTVPPQVTDEPDERRAHP
jgi:hypothetical protein